jgi:hypothetical protein
LVKGEFICINGKIQVSGMIAGVGPRMLQRTAKMMATQFFTALEAEAKIAEGEVPRKHGFFRTALRWFSGWLSRMLGRQIGILRIKVCRAR